MKLREVGNTIEPPHGPSVRFSFQRRTNGLVIAWPEGSEDGFVSKSKLVMYGGGQTEPQNIMEYPELQALSMRCKNAQEFIWRVNNQS